MIKQISEYTNYLSKELGYSEDTIKAYVGDLNQYQNYLEMKRLNYLIVSKDEVRDYLKYLDKLNSTILNLMSQTGDLLNAEKGD